MTNTKKNHLKLTAKADRILVRIDPAEERNLGGIILPSGATTTGRAPNKGTIVMLGPQNIHFRSGEPIPWGVKVGDRIIFSANIGDKICNEEVENGKVVTYIYQIIREDDIWCGFEEVE